LILALSCSGLSATTSCAVEQLGLAMIAALAEAHDRVGVDLRHDQGNVAVVAPGRGIIDHDRPGGGDLRRPFLGHGASGRHQADVDAGKIKMFERFDLQRLIAIGDFGPQAPARGERDHFIGREQPLGQDIEHLPAHIAGRADDGHFVTHP
jgi:hypothetical protein